ncbi:hypothetical protein J1N35_024673 [Gossypium stocksii]|uniref:Uncharacterized protein n=1 Tax=Gossypium stocksii TaxID=47602 RepID=A0A9D3ZVJ8_9ROSI|nr:hypothetical protein J1N35_024673 [Gossypium stocksii]
MDLAGRKACRLCPRRKIADGISDYIARPMQSEGEAQVQYIKLHPYIDKVYKAASL